MTYTVILNAAEYKIDLMDDIFGYDLQDLQKLKVTSASKSSQTLDTTPARMIIVSKEQIRERGYRGLDELLNDLPGFHVMQFADSGIHNQIGIRGVMGTNYFKVLEDGIEIDQTDGEVLSHGMQYPLIGIERVEILYGPASVVYGADALSGVINLISDKSLEGEVGTAVGKDGYRYLYASKRFTVYAGTLSLKAHYHHDQDYNLDKAYPDLFWYKDIKNGSTVVQSAANREFDFQPNITKSFGTRYEKEGFDTGLNYRYSSESTLIAMNQGNSTSNLFDDNSNLNVEQVGWYGRYTTRMVDDIKSTSTLSFDSTELLLNSYFINKYTAYQPGYKYSYSTRKAFEETMHKRYGTHDLLWGASYERFTSTPMTYDLPSQNLSGTIYFNGSTIPVPIYTIHWNNAAIYLQDQIALGNEFQLSIAGRYDRNSAYGSTFNPRIALIHPGEALTQKLIYSRAFLAPSNYQKYKIYGNPLKPNTLGDGNTYQTDRFRVANPDLRPEKSENFEYNIDWFATKNDQLSLSVYHSRITDIISNEESLPDKAGYIPDTTIIDPVGAANSTKAILYGGDISYQGHSYFPGFDVSYWANYSYIDGKIDYIYDYSIPYSPKHMFKSGGTLRYQQWRVSPTFHWIGPIMAAPYDDGKLASVNGSFVTNLFVSYDIDKTKRIAFKAENLFDERYYGVRYNSSSKYLSPQETQMFSIIFSMSL